MINDERLQPSCTTNPLLPPVVHTEPAGMNWNSDREHHNNNNILHTFLLKNWKAEHFLKENVCFSVLWTSRRASGGPVYSADPSVTSVNNKGF